MQDFISKLLLKDPEERMGCKEVMEHEYFSNVKWSDFRAMRVVPPYAPPTKKNVADTSNFGTEYTYKPVKLSVMHVDEDMARESDVFLKEFSYYPTSYY